MTDFNWTATFGEVKTAAQWTDLGDNDRALQDGTGIDSGAILARHLKNTTVKGAQSLTMSPVGTSEGDVASSSVTFTPDVASTALIFFGGQFQINSGATRNLTLYLNIDGSNVTNILAQDNAGASETQVALTNSWLVNLTAASHTIKLRAIANTGGTLAFYHGYWRAIIFSQ